MLVLYGRLTFQPACVFRGLNKGLSCVCVRLEAAEVAPELLPPTVLPYAKEGHALSRSLDPVASAEEGLPFPYLTLSNPK